MLETNLTGLTLSEIKTLMNLGNGKPLEGVKRLLSKVRKRSYTLNKYERTSVDFIESYLELTPDKKDRITVSDLYKEYCEYTDLVSGKKIFNQKLESYGFVIRKAGSNRLTVFYIKSNWL